MWEGKRGGRDNVLEGQSSSSPFLAPQPVIHKIVACVYSAYIFYFPIVFNGSPAKAAVVENKNNKNLVDVWKLDGFDGNTGRERSTVEAFVFFPAYVAVNGSRPIPRPHSSHILAKMQLKCIVYSFVSFEFII